MALEDTFDDGVNEDDLATHLPGLRRFLRSAVQCEATADDLSQELWIRFARNRDRAASIGGPYLWQIAKSLIIDHFRRETRRLTSAETYAILTDDQEVRDPERAMIARSEVALLAKLIASMPARRKDVFMASRVRGETHAKIAARLGVSLRTVDYEMRRALETCAQAMADYHGRD